ncbi:MAG: UvrD-helicase domain-containing protein [Bacteroidales bacterium]|nr:UvrD-helicase domain-containing protein [Bacteroidales bacterium]
MDTSRFIICRAAAGSGKTYTLVRQYLQLAFSAPEQELRNRFTRILAITFTNKAANEMKERILKELDKMAAQGTTSDMGSDIAQQMQLTDDTLRRYATIVRQAILHNYSDFAVCTIDSFMHRLVRTFAHDLNLPLNFDVYIDNSELIQNAVDDLMAMVGTEGQEELTEVMCEFAESRMSDGKSYMIENELANLAAELFKEQTPEYLRDLSHLDMAQFRQINTQMRQANRAYEQQLQTLGKEGLQAITDAGIGPEDFYQSRNGAGAFFRKLADGIMSEPNSYVLAYIEGDKLGSAKCSPAIRDILAALKPQLQVLFQRIQTLRETEGLRYNTRLLLLKNLYSLALINKLNELVINYSKENEIVHISEFNKRISEVVQDEPTPFIYERIGNRYYNYLIDEFQDTSRMQWQNLVPLIENGVGSGHTSLVVGDGKQAIYRFRQGDVDQFINLPQVDNPIHGRLLEKPGISLADRLERNFRSARTVVDFNNDFFEWVIRNRFADNAQLQSIYIGDGDEPDLKQQPTKEGGYVQIGFYELEKDRTPLWEKMLNDIHTLVNEKGYQLRDMTILARDNNTLADISTFLTEQGIPVVSSESFLLTQSRVVMLLRNLLQYLLDGSDRIAAMRVLQYLHSLGRMQSLHEEAFLKNRGAVDLDQVLQSEGLDLNSNLLRQLGLYDCFEEALRMLHLGDVETSYTATLLNVVARYTSNHRQDLGEFLEWFDKQKDRLSTSTASDLNAIQLMTIHKAKGLEKPIVLYPILTKREQQDSIWVHIPEEDQLPLPSSLIRPTQKDHTLFDKEYQEELQKSDMDRINVLYVALTRPKEKLLIYCQASNKEDGNDYSSLLQAYLAQRNDLSQVQQRVVAIGENSPKPVPKQGNEPTPEALNVSISSISFPNWSDRIAIAQQSSKIFGQFDEESIRWGNLMHELLALVHSTADAEEALVTFFSRNHLTQSAQTEPAADDTNTIANELKDSLLQMLSQPEVARFFRPEDKSLNECNLVWHGGVLRPDRVVFAAKENETWVVDFKTGVPNTEHHAQVMHYCDAIRAMGHPTVKGYLLYIGHTHCQVLPCA